MSSLKYNQRALNRIFREPRGVIGFNEDKNGNAVITTARPQKLNTDGVFRSEVKNIPYEEYGIIRRK